MRAALAVGVAVALAACEGALGTIRIELVAAPGADPLAGVERVRLTLTSPETVTETERNADGSFDLAVEVVAEGQVGQVILEGFDAGDEVIAVGYSGALPIGAIDADIVVYVAAPRSIAAAPVTLPAPRSELGAARLAYGVLWAGGRDDAGAPVDDLAIYNVYLHDFQDGEPLPQPRAAPTVVAGALDYVYVLGGDDAAGEPQPQVWRFDTEAAPAGDYLALSNEPALARTGADAVPIGAELFLVAGEPAALIDGLALRGSVLDDAPALAGRGATTELGSLAVTAVFAGAGVEGGAVAYLDGFFVPLEDAPAELARSGHAVVALPGGDALVIAGARDGALETTAVRVRGTNLEIVLEPDLLATPRRDAGVAVSAGRLIVAGGIDANGDHVGDAEIFDATTLQPLATAPLLVPRASPTVQGLGNGQFIIAGGTTPTGPTEILELYTP